EFYRSLRSDDETEAALLRDVTQEYERAAFGQRSISADAAGGVLERARRLCGFDDWGDDGAPADD
ncbi:hypothetical protein, partial [Natrinema soli]